MTRPEGGDTFDRTQSGGAEKKECAPAPALQRGLIRRAIEWNRRWTDARRKTAIQLRLSIPKVLLPLHCPSLLSPSVRPAYCALKISQQMFGLVNNRPAIHGGQSAQCQWVLNLDNCWVGREGGWLRRVGGVSGVTDGLCNEQWSASLYMREEAHYASFTSNKSSGEHPRRTDAPIQHQNKPLSRAHTAERPLWSTVRWEEGTPAERQNGCGYWSSLTFG